MNYIVEFYIDNKYYSSISEDINKIHTFVKNTYLKEVLMALSNYY